MHISLERRLIFFFHDVQKNKKNLKWFIQKTYINKRLVLILYIAEYTACGTLPMGKYINIYSKVNVQRKICYLNKLNIKSYISKK